MGLLHWIKLALIRVLLSSMLIVTIGCSSEEVRKEDPTPTTDTQPTPPNAYKLKVSRHDSLSFNDSGADAIFSLATQVAHDTACDIGLIRDGGITIFVSPNIVNSPEDLDNLMHQPGHVKVLNQINWCGGVAPNILGCAPIPGDSYVVVRYQPTLEGILWLHEYGHNKGLQHRDNPDAVMNPTISPTRTNLTTQECTNYKIASIHAAATDSPSPSYDLQQASDKRSRTVREFVRQVFIHGVPYEEARKFGLEDVPTLFEMLNDEGEQEYWANIVVVLGIIGDEQTPDRLIQFIEGNGDEAISPAQYRAKTSAIVALGYLVNKAKSLKALSYLQNKVNPQKWQEEKKVLWRSPFQASMTARDEQLSSMAILGLALSGSEEASKTLEAMKQPASSDSAEKFQRQVGPLVQEAMRTNKLVRERGLSEYYRKRGKE
ncbi:MAG: matrixin family metalloprotease [Nitrospira sp.]|nr:matrixin family metalloprotease [Nitrospira sp.]